MDDTTRRDVIAPNFDTGAWQQPPATVDAPTRPSAGAFIHERPTTPTPVDSLVAPLARPRGAVRPLARRRLPAAKTAPPGKLPARRFATGVPRRWRPRFSWSLKIRPRP